MEKSILDLTEATSLADAMYSIIEDGISSKKFKLKTLQNYLISALFLNYYPTLRQSSNIQLTDLLSISPAGDNPTQKTTFENLAAAFARLYPINGNGGPVWDWQIWPYTELATDDQIPVGHASENHKIRTITLLTLLSFLKNQGCMENNLNNSVKATLTNWNRTAPNEVDYIVAKATSAHPHVACAVKFKSGLVIETGHYSGSAVTSMDFYFNKLFPFTAIGMASIIIERGQTNWLADNGPSQWWWAGSKAGVTFRYMGMGQAA
ncbi:MAG: hypothetical protein LBH29_04350 [Elusimicrobiota bacterium]|jgi:hypothetical protein|nr:hypothetical protein [Elusimicrobiota bacterium]